ncbi:Fe-S cluster assembly protein SufD [Brucella sp. 10RB9214]|uniref:Fe-S cluster assembly protein SufD n=1 Tax=unclassified Brucella TaxID=2632610 RepID=UPI0009726D33|nr:MULTISPECIES: Fe-S cluster assembly protein SufD [unclassified Brucella]APY12930.1 Fe-S cluster assembly protein SufD [Brucella sp. 09RB8910]MRN46053.1 Fe-S cluster assembly protein SufD [Brucella sp. 10RB9212]MRN51177.1 Fe-S cluster assembly protein SufD [Brucella sp. 10RB9214]
MNIQATPAPKPRTPAESMLIDSFAERMGDLPGNGDVVIARDTALEALKVQGLPSRRIESWHYTDFRTLLKGVAAFDTSAGTQALPALIAGSSIIAASNGVALAAKAPKGVSLTPVREALADGSLVSQLRSRGFDDTIGQINAAYVSDGWMVSIADDTELEEPLEIQNIQNAGQGHTRFPVRIGANVKGTIIERQNGGEGDAFSTSVNHVTVGDGAQIIWVILRDFGQATQLSQFNVTIGKGSRLTLYIVNAGGKLVRQEVHVNVEGEDSDFELRGLNLLADDSHTDVTMTVGHLVENTRSTEIVRNVVKDRARGVFQGMIRVAQIAQKTDARMACNTLLLSDEGEFDAKPELEIFADDVACGHGATVAELSRDYLFYLMARGIPENEARGLLIKAFIAEIIEELEDETLVEALEGVLSNWLAVHA